MSVLGYYRHLGRGKFKQIAEEDAKNLKQNNPATVTVDRHMFINNQSTAFSSAEFRQILEFINSKKRR